MKIYLLIVFFLIINALVLGVAPILISMPDWLAFSLGDVLIVALLPADYWLIRLILKPTKKETA